MQSQSKSCRLESKRMTTLNAERKDEREFPNHPADVSRTVLERTVEIDADGHTDNDNDDARKELRFLFLGCEADDTYGPYNHTATLFIELICRAVQQCYCNQQQQQQAHEVPATQRKQTSTTSTRIHVTLTVYRISQGDFPTHLSDEEWNHFHGIIVPGSHGAAYDAESTPWILEFGNLLRAKHQPGRPPMLGICFGHQLLAHVAHGDGGKAVLCPNGTQVGRKSMTVTEAGRRILFPPSISKGKPPQSTSQEEMKEGSLAEHGGAEESTSSTSTSTSLPTIDLYYSHGDMVQQLPSHAIVLASSDKVPIQAAAYFATEHEALKFTRNGDTTTNNNNDTIRPTAITFQAHPEFAVSRTLGLERTLGRIMDGMQHRGVITPEARQEIGHDAQLNFDSVERDSLQVLMRVGQVLEWW
jgi:GMP synthase-like glutamine amidotransferase